MSDKQKSKTAKSLKPRPKPKKGSVPAPSSSESNSYANSDAGATVRMVRELAAIVERRSLTEVIIDTEDLTLTIRRGESAPPAPPQPQTTIVTTAPAMPQQPLAPVELPAAVIAPAAAAASPSDEANGEHHLVTSPFVGTFYRRPNPDSEPYVKIGDRVEKGTVLCIVEAMKLMNEIEADASGVIAAILVEDANPVEYGQPLFKIAPG